MQATSYGRCPLSDLNQFIFLGTAADLFCGIDGQRTVSGFNALDQMISAGIVGSVNEVQASLIQRAGRNWMCWVWALTTGIN